MKTWTERIPGEDEIYHVHTPEGEHDEVYIMLNYHGRRLKVDSASFKWNVLEEQGWIYLPERFHHLIEPPYPRHPDTGEVLTGVTQEPEVIEPMKRFLAYLQTV